MRVLILSDIHSNLEALAAVLDAAPACDTVWNLGDVVGYGASPNEVIERSRAAGSVFVRGNHDKVCGGGPGIETFNSIARQAARWTRSILAEGCADWLRQMPAGPIMPDGPDVGCMHGSPLDEDQYITTVRDARLPLARAATRINFFGHTHLQGGFATNGEDWFQLAPEYHPGGADEYELPIREHGRYLINPGSVGQPRDGDWRAAFAIYETAENGARRVLFCRVPYDVEKAQHKIVAAGLPDRLASRLQQGR